MIGGTLDRNGLRPARYVVTDDDFVVLASEAGALDVPAERIVSKGRIKPGRMFIVDTVRGRVIEDEEIKRDLAARRPYRAWVTANRVGLDELPEPISVAQPDPETLLQHQTAFGYTQEELSMVLTPMAVTGEEPIGSMGTDTPLAVLSQEPQLLYGYFKQLFAQVTNPPIDPIREQLVMSLSVNIGPRTNVLGERPEHARRIRVRGPILTSAQLEKIRVGRRARGRPALPLHDAARALPRRRRCARAAPRPRVALPARVAGGARGEHDPRPQRPRRRRRLGADPVAARHGGGAPPSRARGPAHRGRPHRRDGRRARRVALRAAHRLRRGHDQSVPRARVARRARALRQPAARRSTSRRRRRSTSRPSRRVCSR